MNSVANVLLALCLLHPALAFGDERPDLQQIQDVVQRFYEAWEPAGLRRRRRPDRRERRRARHAQVAKSRRPGFCARSSPARSSSTGSSSSGPAATLGTTTRKSTSTSRRPSFSTSSCGATGRWPSRRSTWWECPAPSATSNTTPMVARPSGRRLEDRRRPSPSTCRGIQDGLGRATRRAASRPHLRRWRRRTIRR